MCKIESQDRITKFFSNRNLFITGGTGFVGKVFIEKLIRACPNVGTIYLLIRNKKNKKPEDRLLDLLNCEIFNGLKKSQGLDEILKHLKVISGDSTELNLGMSEKDRQEITSNVHIIYNFAATIRFNESLKRAVILNVRGTRETLKLGKQCKKLELFYHMSTAYCHLHINQLLDKPYPPPADPHEIISIVELLSDAEIDSRTSKILGAYPNTYSFTKALSEALVEEASKEIPAIITRPSNIIPILREPIPGWGDNLNGCVGLMVASGKGALRVIYGDVESYADFVPVDLLANAICISTWNYVELKDHDHFVSNYVSSAEIKVTYKDLVTIGIDVAGNSTPFNMVLWYPSVIFTKNKMLFTILTFLLQWMPAYFLDFLLFCLGYPTGLVKAQQRIAAGMDVLSYYICNKWDFSNKNVLYLRSIMGEAEKAKFSVEVGELDVKKYIEDTVKAMREYYFRETVETLPRARKVMKILYFADKIIKMAVFTFFLYWTSKFVIFIFGS